MGRVILVALVAGASGVGCGAGAAEECVLGDDDFEVVAHEVSEPFVTLEVATERGCEARHFEVWWSGVMGTSDPPRVPLEVQHFDEGELCDDGTTQVVIDLSLLHEELPVDSAIVELRSGEQGSRSLDVAFEYEFPNDDSAEPPEGGVVEIDPSCGALGP